MNLQARVVPCSSRTSDASIRRPFSGALWQLVVCCAGAAGLALCQDGAAQNVLTSSGAGGIRIGPTETATTDAAGSPHEAVRQVGQRSGKAARQTRRCISLRRLFAAVRQQSARRFSDLPEEQRWMGGLTQICHLEVHPEAHDVLLIGRGEAWVHNQSGEVVGAESGWPVYRMDDFATALRAFYFRLQPSVSCSIDPTEDGLTRLRALMRQPPASLTAGQWLSQVEEAVGPHAVTIQGVGASSRFARIMLAADVRMKRLALQLDQPPLRSLPGYLQLARPTSEIDLPRWWLELSEEVLRRSPDSLQWTFTSRPLVACTDHARGRPDRRSDDEHRALDRAERWGELLTRHLPELCSHYPEFAELHNVSGLCLVAMLLRNECLLEQLGCRPPEFATQMQGEAFENPASLPTLTNVVSRGRVWLVAASGGIDLNVDQVLQRVTIDSGTTVPTRLPYPEFASGWWTDVELHGTCKSEWPRRGVTHRLQHWQQNGKTGWHEAMEEWRPVLHDRSADVFLRVGPNDDPRRPRSSGENQRSTAPCVIIVLDRSDSMCRRLGNATLLQHARREVSHLINSLSETSRFNVLLFGSDVAAWRPRAEQASATAKSDALRFVGRAESLEGTASYDALEWAVLSAPAGGHLVFVSDGWPTVGKHVAPQEIVAAIQTLNAEGHLSIHCVGIACDRAQAAFMQELAAANNGTFRSFGSGR